MGRTPDLDLLLACPAGKLPTTAGDVIATSTTALAPSGAAPARANARLANQAHTRSFTTLMADVRGAGLLGRARTFYVLVFTGLLVALGGIATGMALLDHSWLQLLMAGALGLVLTQFAFLGHEASHRQIFASNRANDRSGRVLAVGFAGISYSWWMNKHTRHHGNPNRITKDPDIEVDAVSFTVEDASTKSGLAGWFTRRQAWFFFPLLLLEGVNLHMLSIKSLIRGNHGRVEHRGWELAALGLRLGLWAALLFWIFPVGLAAAFLGVQLAVFGLYMGGTFAPNHMGMPIVPADVKLDFLSKQVRTSRNIRGGIWMSALMGGLNHQVEHHLFPSMPRPHLRAARKMVLEHCRALDVPYTETTLAAAYRSVLGHLKVVGLAARDPFDCPAARSMRFG